ncbi:LysR family transcriptional regulator [Roseibium sp. CAU 1637]|uniref:LysR family transcriptional regulator n=1 Tax=Roseibium limicola TaxID=2816037 RepID=A0A939EN50_9HYPH|nr:LysR family transcriptional regulator [Roseibium limicola]MBO0344373.1 LysR family transcriptional regulator [Roseibium limicola]
MSNNLNLNGLRLFVEVAAHGSFSEVARRRGLPVSSVSRHISALEQSLGQKLLVRNTRSLRLTDHGHGYYQAVRDVLSTLDLASEQVRGSASEPRGVLRINAPLAFGRRHIAPHLALFQARFNALEVELTLTDALIDPIADGADVIVRIGSLKDSTLLRRKLADQSFVVAAAPAYLERHGVPVKPDDLSKHNCLIYRGHNGEMPWRLRQGEEQVPSLSVNGDLRSNDAESLIAAALAAQGIVLFPTWLLHEHLAYGYLQPILTDWLAGSEQTDGAIHLLYPENRMLSSKVSAFLDFLGETVGRPAYWDRPVSLT